MSTILKSRLYTDNHRLCTDNPLGLFSTPHFAALNVTCKFPTERCKLDALRRHTLPAIGTGKELQRSLADGKVLTKFQPLLSARIRPKLRTLFLHNELNQLLYKRLKTLMVSQ